MPATLSASTYAAAAQSPRQTERRLSMRKSSATYLWLVDHQGGTILRCQCTDVSERGARLRVPLGYGITEGQRFELRARMPGHEEPFQGTPFHQTWASVVRAQVHAGDGEAFLDVGVSLDKAEVGSV